MLPSITFPPCTDRNLQNIQLPYQKLHEVVFLYWHLDINTVNDSDGTVWLFPMIAFLPLNLGLEKLNQQNKCKVPGIPYKCKTETKTLSETKTHVSKCTSAIEEVHLKGQERLKQKMRSRAIAQDGNRSLFSDNDQWLTPSWNSIYSPALLFSV